jgi:heat-inducible transcriptional repressor
MTPERKESDERGGLSERRGEILRRVVEAHIETGQPVGSRTLAAIGGFPWSPSTLRGELAWLESAGLLDHPHTSAGRVPTDSGYRYYVDRIVGERPSAPALPIDLTASRLEIDAALRATTGALAEVSNLLAVVTAPALAQAEVRHIEVMALQPRIVMIVVITATGDVAKRTFMFEEPVDAGLAAWAREYLNEAVTGQAIGSRALRRALGDPGLSRREQEFLDVLAPVFSDIVEPSSERIYVDGAARLVSALRSRDVVELSRIAQLLEERQTMLELLRHAVGSNRVVARIGGENVEPAFHALAAVSAAYGLATRPLGSISIIGPVRMDYTGAIATVRSAASTLSAFVEDVYGPA